MEVSQSPLTDKASYNALIRPATDVPQTTNEIGQDETKNSFSKDWILIALYSTCCFALCFAIAYTLDGYKAINDGSARSANGTFKLRPSDFNTLISMATSIITYLVDSYASIAVWACALTLLRTTGLTAGQLDHPPSSLGLSRMARTMDPSRKGRLVCRISYIALISSSFH